MQKMWKPVEYMPMSRKFTATPPVIIVVIMTTAAILALPSISGGFAIAAADNNITHLAAVQLHNQAWLEIAARAADEPAYLYALYNSRSLAVKHPELYLQADALFNQLLTDDRQMLFAYYLERSQDLLEQANRYDEIRREGGKPFSWAEFKINRHHPVSCQDIYHTDAFLPFVDQRLFFLGSALKGSDWQATPLSMAEFLYFKAKEQGKKPLLMVTETGNAYVYTQSSTTSELLRYDGEEATQPEGKVIMVFNEEFVWYPLMNRDDTGESTLLAEAVEKYAGPNNLPALTDFERKRIEKLKGASALRSEIDRLYALYYAAKLHATTWNDYPEIMRELYPRYARIAGFNGSHGPNFITYRNAYIARLSSRLSPTAACLAAVARESQSESLNVLVSRMINAYLEHAETRSGHSNLELWYHSELHYLNLDDNMLSRASNCIYSATNVAAMLDLADISGLQAYVVAMKYTKRGGGHAYLAIFRGDEYGTSENGGWSYGFNGIYEQRLIDRNGMCISGIITKKGWLSLATEKDYGILELNGSLEQEATTRLLGDINEKSSGRAIICLQFTSREATEVVNVEEFLVRYQYGEGPQLILREF
ncbi:MAG: hypothetical protein UMV23_06135 [Halanaerobium sp.]|nr:hypothetical protein [Halanaerobium sp.]